MIRLCNKSAVTSASLLLCHRFLGSSSALYLKAGDKTSVTRLITKDDVVTFASVTGDSNEIHLNEDQPIVHGALLNGLVSGVIGTQLPGHGTMVVQQTLRFPKPCYAGEEVTIHVEVTNVRKIVSVEFSVIVPKENKTVLEGDAKLFINK